MTPNELWIHNVIDNLPVMLLILSPAIIFGVMVGLWTMAKKAYKTTKKGQGK